MLGRFGKIEKRLEALEKWKESEHQGPIADEKLKQEETKQQTQLEVTPDGGSELKLN
jgi:hypothetical protein